MRWPFRPPHLTKPSRKKENKTKKSKKQRKDNTRDGLGEVGPKDPKPSKAKQKNNISQRSQKYRENTHILYLNRCQRQHKNKKQLKPQSTQKDRNTTQPSTQNKHATKLTNQRNTFWHVEAQATTCGGQFFVFVQLTPLSLRLLWLPKTPLKSCFEQSTAVV